MLQPVLELGVVLQFYRSQTVQALDPQEHQQLVDSTGHGFMGGRLLALGHQVHVNGFKVIIGREQGCWPIARPPVPGTSF